MLWRDGYQPAPPLNSAVLVAAGAGKLSAPSHRTSVKLQLRNLENDLRAALG